MTDLVAQERKFVANSRLKKAEKINFLSNLVPIKTVLLLPFFLKDPVEQEDQVSFLKLILDLDLSTLPKNIHRQQLVFSLIDFTQI